MGPPAYHFTSSDPPAKQCRQACQSASEERKKITSRNLSFTPGYGAQPLLCVMWPAVKWFAEGKWADIYQTCVRPPAIRCPRGKGGKCCVLAPKWTIKSQWKNRIRGEGCNQSSLGPKVVRSLFAWVANTLNPGAGFTPTHHWRADCWVEIGKKNK